MGKRHKPDEIFGKLREAEIVKPARLVSVAVANKTARTAWALLSRQEDYRRTAAL